MCFTSGSVVATPMGTTAPFSAMSGAVSVTSLLATGVPAPKAFITSATLLASKAALFHASASRGNRPVAASRPATRALCLSVSRRVCIDVLLTEVKWMLINDDGGRMGDIPAPFGPHGFAPAASQPAIDLTCASLRVCGGMGMAPQVPEPPERILPAR